LSIDFRFRADFLPATAKKETPGVLNLPSLLKIIVFYYLLGLSQSPVTMSHIAYAASVSANPSAAALAKADPPPPPGASDSCPLTAQFRRPAAGPLAVSRPGYPS